MSELQKNDKMSLRCRTIHGMGHVNNLHSVFISKILTFELDDHR